VCKNLTTTTHDDEDSLCRELLRTTIDHLTRTTEGVNEVLQKTIQTGQTNSTIDAFTRLSEELKTAKMFFDHT